MGRVRIAPVARADIPDSLAALTPEWLTAQLRSEGVLEAGRVTGLRAEILGEGEGFVGEVARLHLELEGAVAPRSLIAKLPTPVPENRLVGELLGLYEREILFYRELAEHVPLRKPRLYGSDMDPNPAGDSGPAIVEFIDRLPLWLRRILVALIRWIASRSTRRYVLLLEDLDSAQVGDQVSGLDPAECARVLSALARTQATLWASPVLEGHSWIARPDIGARLSQQQFDASRPAFDERFGPRLPHWTAGTIDWIGENGVELLRALHGGAPQTLIHGDFRLDNLLFDQRGADEPIAIDWQAVSRGPGVFDVAYFLSGSLDTEVPTEEERALVRGYHETLVASGVEGYDLAACLRDYERSMLLMLHRLVTIDTMEFGSERGLELIDLWVDRVVRRVRDVDLDAALPGHREPPRLAG
jgi:hypothetical protein